MCKFKCLFLIVLLTVVSLATNACSRAYNKPRPEFKVSVKDGDGNSKKAYANYIHRIQLTNKDVDKILSTWPKKLKPTFRIFK